MKNKYSPAEMLRDIAASHGVDIDHDRLDEFVSHCEAPALTTAAQARALADYHFRRPKCVDMTMRDGRIVKARLI